MKNSWVDNFWSGFYRMAGASFFMLIIYIVWFALNILVNGN